MNNIDTEFSITDSTALPWQLYMELCNGQWKVVEGILGKHRHKLGYFELLQGICGLWEGKEDTPVLLNKVFALLHGREHLWVYWALTEYYLTNQKAYDNNFLHWLSEKQLPEQLGKFSSKTFWGNLVDICRARFYKNRDGNAKAVMVLDLIKPSNDFTRGLTNYYYAQLTSTKLKDSVIPKLDSALKYFKGSNKYFYALTLLEYSRQDIPSQEALKSLQDAAGLFEQLKQPLLYKQCQDNIKVINKVTTRSRTAKLNPNSSITDDRVGNCLFISPEMIEIRKMLDLIAAEDVEDSGNVLILGPTGTGKEQIAKAIHQLSEVKGKFVAINCATLQPGLAQSELFGHEKGAFTDARERRLGCFEQAKGGTLFLDEIGELPLDIQAVLLRVLQEKIIRRVGGNEDINISCRILAATNRDLDRAAIVWNEQNNQLINSFSFRADLRARFVWSFSLPPLSKRPDDIMPLAQEFLHRFGGDDYEFTASAKQSLLNKEYDSNIRSLQNAVRQMIAQAKAQNTKTINVLITEQVGLHNADLHYETVMKQAEADLIRKALAKAGGNKEAAIRLLAIASSSFYRLLAKHKIN